MKVQFDSNTYRRVFSPDIFPKSLDFAACQAINQAIKSGRIEAFLSETIFTLEAVQTNSRLEFFRDDRATVSTAESISDDGWITIEFKIGPNPNAFLGFHPMYLEHVEAARKLGVRTLRFPRLAGLTNPGIEDMIYKLEDTSLGLAHDRMFAANKLIESLGCGMEAIDQLLKKLSIAEQSTFMDKAKSIPDEHWKLFAKSVAEWADGDSVAVAIGYKMDYLCTADKAKAAGADSIFSQRNLQKVQTEFPELKTCTVTELSGLTK